MNPAVTIWKRECLAALRSTAFWWIAAGFAAVLGLRFTSALRIAAGTIEHMPAVFCTQLLLVLCIPVALFTMSLFASERVHGTLEALMTAPVSDAQVVLGKFAAACTLVFISLLLACLVLPIYMAYAAPAPACSRPSLYTGLGVVALFAVAGCAGGALVSLLAPHPAAAALATGVFTLACAAAFTGNVPGFGGRLLLLPTDIADFARGSADTRVLFAAISAIAFFLFCAVRVLESRRWITSSK
ncbi:MAG: ABC transporter permease [Kiritimatiellia bacterium]|jgi:ABC-2 type transport system permease protein